INVPYVGMCVGASNDSGSFASGERFQVIDIAPRPTHQAFILYPGQRLSNPAKLFGFHQLSSLGSFVHPVTCIEYRPYSIEKYRSAANDPTEFEVMQACLECS